MSDGKVHEEGAIRLGKMLFDNNDDAVAAAVDVARACQSITHSDRCIMAEKLMHCSHTEVAKRKLGVDKMMIWVREWFSSESTHVWKIGRKLQWNRPNFYNLEFLLWVTTIKRKLFAAFRITFAQKSVILLGNWYSNKCSLPEKIHDDVCVLCCAVCR